MIVQRWLVGMVLKGEGKSLALSPIVHVRRVLNCRDMMGWGWASAVGSPLGCRTPFHFFLARDKYIAPLNLQKQQAMR